MFDERLARSLALGFFDSDPYVPSPNAPQINEPSGGFGKLFVFPQHSDSDDTRALDNFSYTVGPHNRSAHRR